MDCVNVIDSNSLTMIGIAGLLSATFCPRFAVLQTHSTSIGSGIVKFPSIVPANVYAAKFQYCREDW